VYIHRTMHTRRSALHMAPRGAFRGRNEGSAFMPARPLSLTWPRVSGVMLVMLSTINSLLSPAMQPKAFQRPRLVRVVS